MTDYTHPENQYGIIYIATSPSGKYYIGQTKNDLAYRKAQHKNLALKAKSKFPFHNAIRKYGIENFQWKILQKVPIKYLSEIEIFYISFLKSTWPYGYNATKGGDGIKDSKIAGDKIRSSKLGKKRPKFSDEWLENMRLAQLGKKQSNKAKQLISLKSKGHHKNYLWKPRSGTSKYRGVSKTKQNTWRSCIKIKNKQIHLGVWKTEEEAAIAWNKAAIKYFGNNCYQNEVKNA